MRPSEFFRIFHSECCTHWVTWRHDYSSDLLQVERRVCTTLRFLVEDVDALIYNNEERRQNCRLENKHFITENVSLIACQQITRYIIYINNLTLLRFVVLALGFDPLLPLSIEPLLVKLFAFLKSEHLLPVFWQFFVFYNQI